MGLYKIKESDSSCNINDIQGFTYGPVTSRFWLFRKHFNQMTDTKFYKMEKQDCLPFYPWECLTLDLGSTHVFLVIKNEVVMKNFIKFLIYSLQTVDGKKGTAMNLLETMLRE